MAKYYDENANIQLDKPGRLMKVEVPRLCHQILLEENQWAQQTLQNLGQLWVPMQSQNLKMQPQNLPTPQHSPLINGGRIDQAKSVRKISQGSPLPHHDPRVYAASRTPSPLPPPSPTHQTSQLAGIAEIRREKLKNTASAVDDDLQSKLKDLDEAMRDTHLSTSSFTTKQINYITYMKNLQQQPIKKRNLTVEEKMMMKKYETMELPKKVIHKTFQPDAGSCCCDRPISNVVCYYCLYTRKGRKMIECPQHPKKLYLSDINACPNCKSSSYLLEKVKE